MRYHEKRLNHWDKVRSKSVLKLSLIFIAVVLILIIGCIL